MITDWASETKEITLIVQLLYGDKICHHIVPVSVQFSCSVMSNPLQHHGLHHTRPPCPSPAPRAYSNSCLSSQYAIQPSYPLLSPSPPAFNPAQHQGFFKWVSSLHQVAKVLYWSLSFSISSSNEDSGLISSRMDWCDLLAVQGAFKIFSSTTIRKCQCFGAQPSLWSNSHIHT